MSTTNNPPQPDPGPWWSQPRNLLIMLITGAAAILIAIMLLSTQFNAPAPETTISHIQSTDDRGGMSASTDLPESERDEQRLDEATSNPEPADNTSSR